METAFVDSQYTRLPTLYKRTATGAVQSWTVAYGTLGPNGIVVTVYGQVGGQAQSTTDVVREGKNLGRSNETTPAQQAELQARQQWAKKVKQGYVESLEAAGSTDNALGAFKPMLAHVYADHKARATFPAYVQPKLDGFRALAVVKGGKCRLYSRTQKEWLTVPHIVAAVEAACARFGVRDCQLDGELYNHDLKHDFNRIASIAKRKGVHPDHGLVQYHVYDYPSAPGGFEARANALDLLLPRDSRSAGPLVRVTTTKVGSEEEMMTLMGLALEDGFEGVMYRRSDAPYEGKRSQSLLKVKEFLDSEFEACGVEEGRGKLMGKAGAIWCYADKGRTKKFKAKMVGALESLEDYLVNFGQKYEGRPLVVKYQNLTPDGVPRFPVGIRFREDE